MAGNDRVEAGRRSVLIVDDDDAIRALVVDCLTGEGYEAVAAPNGVQALGMLDRFRPDLIILDLWMAVMDGWTFAQIYRRDPGPHAPLLLLSGRPTAELVDAVESLGAAGFMTKPFDLQDLLDTVERLLQSADSATATATVTVEMATPPGDAGPGTGTAQGEQTDVAKVAGPPAAAPPAGTVRPPGAGNTAKAIPGTDPRRRYLRRLLTQVATLTNEVQQVGEETRRLLAQESVRKLTRHEADRIRHLRMQSQRLHLELEVCKQEFETVRRSGHEL